MNNIIKSFLVLMAVGILGAASFAKAESGLNTNEQELIGYFQSGIDYNGKHYAIPSDYINQGINYLQQSDVTITDEQKAMIYQKVVDMTLEGIKGGYLVEEAPIPTPEPVTPVLTPQPAAVTPKPAPTQSDLSIPELIESVKTLSEDLGVKIAYNAEDNNIKVVNDAGKTVLMADKTIKNTGYRLNQTFGLSTGLLALIGICILVSRKYKLFAHDDET